MGLRMLSIAYGQEGWGTLTFRWTLCERGSVTGGRISGCAGKAEMDFGCIETTYHCLFESLHGGSE